ncbi:unnamed protein product [Leptosia nina]|uniref:Cilia- and flagella-associated protein 61 N-terminal domain-containing protein n=1 Tax=Leptosia nina TaxID=320188 RepID=A0AAV1J0V8_9NEOP
MSIFFDFNIGAKKRRFRRAVQEDKYEIELLLQSNESEKIFGKLDVGCLIELATLSICMINEKQMVIGFMALCDHPDIAAVNPADWENWMRNMYQKFYLSRNTLFIHAMCCIEDAYDFFLDEALISLFMDDVHLQQIVLMVPPNCPRECITKYQTMKKYNYKKNKARRDDDYEVNYHYFYTALRHDFCLKLRIRRAVEEDNDDIVAILDKSCPQVARIALEGVSGVMGLNSDVNYKMLQNTYELDPYHGLCKSTPLEREQIKRNNLLLRAFGDPIMLGKWCPFDTTPFLEEEKDPDEQSNDNVSVKTKTSKVNFRRSSASVGRSFSSLHRHQESSEDMSEKILLSPILSRRTSFVEYLLEEDPFDYEIVNIDHKLLSVPEVLSQDFLLSNVKKKIPRRSIISDIEQQYRRRSSVRLDRNSNEIKMEKFSGEPNAFMIELFGLHDDIDQSKLRVRRAEIVDIPQVAQLLYSLDGRETLWSVENTILRRNKLEAYVFLSNVSVVGVGILEPPERIDLIRAKFNIDAHRIHNYHVKDQDNNAGFATLKSVLIYPAFEPHYRFFVRDMMRLSGIHSLIWLTAYRNKWVTHKLNSFASVMIPLLPRKSDLDYAPVPELNKLHTLSNSLMAFSCWFISGKLTSVPKVTVDSRLVIVGASRTAMAFLNTLLFGDTSSYLFFTNVTLISPQGLPYIRNSKTLAEMMLLKHHTNSERYLKSVPYTYYVNTVHGSMVDINKQDKYVILSNGSKYYYDRLFLLCGKQYQHPDYLKDILEKEHRRRSGDDQYTRLDVPQSFKSPFVNYFTPNNVFIVNNISDANKALNFVRTIDWNIARAVHKSGMAYDGGIVIDHNFRTNDPNIYAAGPVTRYHRRYFAGAKRHKYYDAYEIGTKLGKFIREELDPLFSEKSECQKKNNSTEESFSRSSENCETDDSFVSVPDFKMPLVKYCILPGGLQYLEVRSPGMKVPNYYVQSLDYNGFVIETFKEGYFKMHFNKDLIADGITCLTPEKYSLENFKKLYGLSSSVLSNVHLRYTTKKLDNLYEFFREPWAHFLYHDHVDELFAIVKELLPKGQLHGETLKEVLIAAVENIPSRALTCHEKLKIRSTFEKSQHHEAITEYVMQWVSENDVLLPMYLQPTERTAYAHDLDKNPVFKRRKRSIAKMLAKIC